MSVFIEQLCQQWQMIDLVCLLMLIRYALLAGIINTIQYLISTVAIYKTVQVKGLNTYYIQCVCFFQVPLVAIKQRWCTNYGLATVCTKE